MTAAPIGAPSGAGINAATGVFSWTPTEAQGPGSYTFIVRITDNGSPNLHAEESITVTVNEVNQAPVLAAIGNKTVNEGSLLSFTASEIGRELPRNTLTYTLIGAPAGAGINGATGVFSWTPIEAQGSGSYTFTVRITDDGRPNRCTFGRRHQCRHRGLQLDAHRGPGAGLVHLHRPDHR